MKSADCIKAIKQWCQDNPEKWSKNVAEPEKVYRPKKKFKRLSKKTLPDGSIERKFIIGAMRIKPTPKGWDVYWMTFTVVNNAQDTVVEEITVRRS